MAKLLLAWRSDMNSEDVTAALMSALEHTSVETEGPSEVRLLACLVRLKKKIDERMRAI